MSTTLQVILIVYAVINVVVLICQFTEESTAVIPNIDKGNPFCDLTYIDLFVLLFIGPAVLIHYVFDNHIGFDLNAKPFKRAKYKIGEQVYYKGKLFEVISSAKEHNGQRMTIRGDFSSVIYVDEDEVSRPSKLEQALK